MPSANEEPFKDLVDVLQAAGVEQGISTGLDMKAWAEELLKTHNTNTYSKMLNKRLRMNVETRVLCDQPPPDSEFWKGFPPEGPPGAHQSLDRVTDYADALAMGRQLLEEKPLTVSTPQRLGALEFEEAVKATRSAFRDWAEDQ